MRHQNLFQRGEPKSVDKWIAGRSSDSHLVRPCGHPARPGLLQQSLHNRSASEIQRERVMRKFATSVALVALLLGVAGVSTPSRAETGQVAVVFTKGGFIIGVGGAEGVLIFRGKRYPFTVSGMSVGFTIGASTTKFVGRALNLQRSE